VAPPVTRLLINLGDREKWRWCADWLAVWVAIMLPWSTSITVVLIGLWCIARLGVRDFTGVFREIGTFAGGLPVALWVLGMVGMLWAEVSWAERIDGLSTFHRLLAIPVLFSQFQRSERAVWVFLGFAASCTALLIMSWGLALIPGLSWRGRMRPFPGVPVKDYITQAHVFTLCAFGLCAAAMHLWRGGHRWGAIGLAMLACAFLANIFYIAPGRTALVTIPILVLLLAFLWFSWRGIAGALALASIVAVTVWYTSPSLQRRVAMVPQEVLTFDPQGAPTSSGERIEFWRKSIAFVADAPVIGHGTGSILDQFRRSVAGQTGIAAEVAANPHNQIFAMMIQFGLVGAVLLLAMWAAHLLLFRFASWPATIGLLVVVQNIVGSLFNSHLFDFVEGWIYVWGVGVVGGMVRQRKQDRMAPQSQCR
jgi:O-antigen ligase